LSKPSLHAPNIGISFEAQICLLSSFELASFEC